MSPKHALALVIGLALSTAANAEEFRQHEAHVHGHVEFNIAQDGKDLLVEITAPGADVVGFEHAPENESQEHTLKHALSTLEDANAVLTINSQAQCEIEEVDVTNTLGAAHSEHEHHHDADEHEGHEHHHDADEHEGHEHHHDADEHEGHEHHHDADEHEGHEHHHHEGHEHGEFNVQYRYSCEQVTKLSNIETDWFNQFPSTESIGVNLFTDTTQSALSLSKDNTNIEIK
ncbi:zinc uptake protein ZrgA [Vibrio mytili]|uniref:Zinc-binding protein n=1 Tax=Vibrio mytili TaxID=50718 RepID=A0A0C3I3N0_9VIBR|nr:DUF2796 domain-containing protein [Vibrio mytili]KIN09630.1 zinc-binding protein [Vibrio mytili]